MHTIGNAGVHVPEDNNPDHGGGPIRRASGVATRTGDGMPPYGTPQMVQRTPHQVVQDAEPGQGYWPGRVPRMKYLPDGRMVKAGALGAPITTSTDDVTLQVGVLETNLNTLDRAIIDWYGTVKHTTAIDQFAAGWDGFRKQVRAFITEWRTQGFAFLKAKLTPGAPSPGPWLKLAWNYYDNARANQDNVRKWREAWTKLSGIGLATPESGGLPSEPKSGLGFWGWTGIIAASAVGGAVVLGYVARRRRLAGGAPLFGGADVGRLAWQIGRYAAVRQLGRYGP